MAKMLFRLTIKKP